MRKACFICGKEFECFSRPAHGHRAGCKRPAKAKTCSKKCAIILASHQHKHG